MKNKEKKFKSLQSVLILLQYYGKFAFHIDTYKSGSIDVYIPIPYDDGLFEFSSVDDCDVWETTYQELLEYLKINQWKENT